MWLRGAGRGETLLLSFEGLKVCTLVQVACTALHLDGRNAGKGLRKHLIGVTVWVLIHRNAESLFLVPRLGSHPSLL